jgi:hypothetical protein
MLREVLAIGFALLPALVVAQQEGGFLDIPWGATPDEAGEIIVDIDERVDMDDGEVLLVLEDRIVASHRATALLWFDDQGFYAGEYRITDTENSGGIFRDIEQKLSTLYGQPTVSETAWLPGASRKQVPSLADIGRGDVQMFSAWDAHRVTIVQSVRVREKNSAPVFAVIDHILLYLDPEICGAVSAHRQFFSSGL